MKKSILLFLTISTLLSFPLFGQEKIKESTVSKKVIVVKKLIDKNGKTTVDRIVKEGEDLDKILLDMDIDLEVEIEEINGVKSEKYKLIKRARDGVEEVIEWNGEGDMPDELREHLLKEITHFDSSGNLKKVYQIDIDAEVAGDDEDKEIKVIINRDGEEHVIEWDGTGEFPEELGENIFILKGDDHEMHGEHLMNVMVDHDKTDGHKKIKIVIEKDGEEPEIIEWEGEGEMPLEIREKLGHHKVHMIEGHGDIEIAEFHEDLNKAFLGVHIADHEQGARILKVEEDSAAQESGLLEGDIITTVNGQKVDGIESLIGALKEYSPEDKIDIHYLREGKETKVKSVLKERPLRPSKFWVHKLDEDYNEDHNVFFFDKDNDIVKRKVIIIKKSADDENIAEADDSTVDKEQAFPEIRGKKLKLTGFNAFPNPTDGVMNVSFVANKSPVIVQVYDISGREVYRKAIQDFDGYFNEDIDLGKHTRGNYILYVVQNEGFFSHQIVLN